MKKNNSFVFGVNPDIKKRRSRFKLPYSHKTTINVGDLVPIYLQEIYPGDTFKGQTDFVCRTTSPFVKVPMDNLFVDIAYFWVPNRLVLDTWKNVMGENTESAWIPEQEYSVPQVKINGVRDIRNISNYFGIPYGSTVDKVSALPFRAYALIYNEFWRDQNLIDPVFIHKNSVELTLNTNDFGPNNYVGKVAKACKLHDYFTTCLPGTQKGTSPTLPIVGTAPVKTSTSPQVTGQQPALQIKNISGGSPTNEFLNQGIGLATRSTSGATVGYGIFEGSESLTGVTQLYPSNLYADLTDGSVNTGTINDLRLLFAIQKMYELDSRSGTRYRESIYSYFGCTSPESVQQVPEYLGGKRIPITITQVNGTGSDNLAEISSNSLSGGYSGYSKSFTEHGFVVGVAVIRQLHTYQQGIERFFFRKNRLDFYNPLFAHLGEQVVSKKELFAFGSNTTENDSVFGYQEPYADLRYRPSIITGGLSSLADYNLDFYHFGDFYDSNPVLGEEFIKETDIYVNRTLTVDSDALPQFIFDFYHNFEAVRVLPLYGIPGVIAHM